MNIGSIQSGHWTDDEVLASLYGVGPSGNHLEECADCQARRAAMQTNREQIERSASAGDGVTSDFLAAQRRAIYQRLDQPVRWWSAAPVRRWAAGLTTACVLASSIFLYEQNREIRLAQERASDARLMQEVANMAGDSGASAMEPLQGLFE